EAERAPVTTRTEHASTTVVRRSAVRVGAANDPAESEADRIGAVLMRAMSSTSTVHQCDSGCDHGTGSRIRRSIRETTIGRTAAAHRCDDTCNHAPRRVLRRASNLPGVHPSAGPDGGPVDAGTVNRIRRATGGTPLDGGIRPRLEATTGMDLGGVRI